MSVLGIKPKISKCHYLVIFVRPQNRMLRHIYYKYYAKDGCCQNLFVAITTANYRQHSSYFKKSPSGDMYAN